ncbi:hypothetical protein E1B28_007799 [Marasmius oreades]|uniref:Uncharacterized protein n=1 Tax=Marasmius oreades TaxID=181124 RepID=A0A9P7S331_9AGAR|nr:uncharacterized protein E1B28_007799 [Marasmius oreades]KAG7094192.1 hypothetical protein E1B28_007799 [Marasmius oreades]
MSEGLVRKATGKEIDEPLYIYITGPEKGQVARAKVPTEDLLRRSFRVRENGSRRSTTISCTQVALHQATKAQYAGYSAMT